MTLYIKDFSCPSCGGPLTASNSQGKWTLHCSRTIDGPENCPDATGACDSIQQALFYLTGLPDYEDTALHDIVKNLPRQVPYLYEEPVDPSSARKFFDFTRNYSSNGMRLGPLNLIAAATGGRSRLDDIIQVTIKKPNSILDFDFAEVEDRIAALVASIPEDERHCRLCGTLKMPFYDYERCTWFVGCRHELRASV